MDFSIVHEQPHLSIYQESGDYQGSMTTGKVTLREVKAVAAGYGLLLMDASEYDMGRTKLFFGVAGTEFTDELELEGEFV